MEGKLNAPLKELSIIGEAVRGCRLCPLSNNRTKAVPGEGRADSRIVFVGEAPGREEDLAGKPFVGRGGKLLDSVLNDLGIDRKDIYITNIVKCRPPRNRVPRKTERDICVATYLNRELDVLDPKIVVLLGRTASSALLGSPTLKEARGRAVVRGRTRYVSTYHPAAVLRNPKLRATLAKDLKYALSSGASTMRRRDRTK